jgi:predicted permease
VAKVDSLGIIAMGFGAFLMFEAVKNPQPTPVKRARDLLKRSAIPAGTTVTTASTTTA